MDALALVVKPTGNGGLGSSPSTTPPVSLASRRTVNVSSVRHQKLSKSLRAILAAEVLDGTAALVPTITLVAQGLDVSVSYIDAARRLTPAQRREVGRGLRPLFLPRAPAVSPVPSTVPATPLVPPVTMGTKKLLAAVVDRIGVSGVRELLTDYTRTAA